MISASRLEKLPLPALVVLPIAIRRARVQALLQELEACLHLARPSPDDIHRLRVNIKKLRAWIRLLRLAYGRRLACGIDQDLRAIAKRVAGERDRDVLEHTVALLQQECGNAAQEALLDALLGTLRSHLPSLTTVEAFSTLTESARQNLLRLCSRQPNKDTLLKGLSCSYRRTRRFGKRACMADASPATCHRWRKRVKYLSYQLLCLTGSPNGKLTSLQKQLAKLGNVLGELQDLEVLEQQVALLPVAADAKALTLARSLLMQARQQRLRMIARLFRKGFNSKRLLISS
jgi:CHAD domain-containing protein